MWKVFLALIKSTYTFPILPFLLPGEPKEETATSLCYETQSLLVCPGHICLAISYLVISSYFFSMTGISQLVYNTVCTGEADKSVKCAHMERNINFIVVEL